VLRGHKADVKNMYVQMDDKRKLPEPELGGIFSLSIDNVREYSGHRLFDSVQE
jgi:hypothetical protein